MEFSASCCKIINCFAVICVSMKIGVYGTDLKKISFAVVISQTNIELAISVERFTTFGLLICKIAFHPGR